MSNTELTLRWRHSSTFPPSTQPEQDDSSPWELLRRLRTRIQDTGEEYRQVLQDIHDMSTRALTQAKSELGDDGVLVQTFIPSITDILRRTVGYVENGIAIATSNQQIPERRILLFRIKTKKPKNKAAISNDLTRLRNSLEGMYSMAMPPTVSSASSDRVDNALIILASIGGTLSVLCDNVAVLAPFKLVAVGLCEVFSTIETLRSNNELAADIMDGVREYFRMVVRKVQKYPAAQTDEDLRKDVAKLFDNLVNVQRTLLKLKRENWHIGPRLVFAQRDKERLDALKNRVQESRNMFEASLHLSTNLRLARGMFEVSTGISELLNLARQETCTSENLAESSTSTLALLLPRSISEAQGTTESQLMLQSAQSDSLMKKWVQVDLKHASHIKHHHSAVSLLPHAGVYFFF